MPTQQTIADLTVEQLESLIRRTVKSAMMDMISEMALTAQIEAQITEQAEITDYLRHTLRHTLGSDLHNLSLEEHLPLVELDD